MHLLLHDFLPGFYCLYVFLKMYFLIFVITYDELHAPKYFQRHMPTILS